MVEMDSPGKTTSIAKATPARRVYRAPLLPYWVLIGGAAVVALIGAYPYYSSNIYVLSLLGKFLCYSIFALSIDLIWGFTGILSLGQAVYFGIGAYMVALSLKMNYALTHPTRFGGKIPDFMEWNSLTRVPDFMTPLYSFPLAVAAALVIPTLLAFLFGVITFKRHIYGVYCAVITLAESLNSSGLHHRISVLHWGLQRHHRLCELCRTAIPVVHPGSYSHLPDRGSRPHSFARWHRVEID